MSCYENLSEALANVEKAHSASIDHNSDNDIEESGEWKNERKRKRGETTSPIFRMKNHKSPETYNDPKELEDETLYMRARENLRKINRVSKSSIAEPKTPSKPGVYVETSIGRFAQIKSLFDRHSRGIDRASEKSLSSGKDLDRGQNSFFKQFNRLIRKKGSKPHQVHNLGKFLQAALQFPWRSQIFIFHTKQFNQILHFKSIEFLPYDLLIFARIVN